MLQHLNTKVESCEAGLSFNDAEQRKQHRRTANRESARKTRERRLHACSRLEAEVCIAFVHTVHIDCASVSAQAVVEAALLSLLHAECATASQRSLHQHPLCNNQQMLHCFSTGSSHSTGRQSVVAKVIQIMNLTHLKMISQLSSAVLTVQQLHCR